MILLCFDVVADFADKLNKCDADFIVSDYEQPHFGQYSATVTVKSSLHVHLEGMCLGSNLYLRAIPSLN